MDPQATKKFKIMMGWELLAGLEFRTSAIVPGSVVMQHIELVDADVVIHDNASVDFDVITNEFVEGFDKDYVMHVSFKITDTDTIETADEDASCDVPVVLVHRYDVWMTFNCRALAAFLAHLIQHESSISVAHGLEIVANGWRPFVETSKVTMPNGAVKTVDDYALTVVNLTWDVESTHENINIFNTTRGRHTVVTFHDANEPFLAVETIKRENHEPTEMLYTNVTFFKPSSKRIFSIHASTDFDEDEFLVDSIRKYRAPAPKPVLARTDTLTAPSGAAGPAAGSKRSRSPSPERKQRTYTYAVINRQTEQLVGLYSSREAAENYAKRARCEVHGLDFRVDCREIRDI